MDLGVFIQYFLLRDVESDTEAEIETVFIHPSYETEASGGAVNDIALIKLKKPVKLDQFIQPACLPYRFARNYIHFKLYYDLDHTSSQLSAAISLAGVRLKQDKLMKNFQTVFKSLQFQRSLLLFAKENIPISI